MKLCVDCQFSVLQETRQKHFYGCTKKSVFRTSLITGIDEFRYYVGCENMRHKNGDCKAEGLLFEQKTT